MAITIRQFISQINIKLNDFIPNYSKNKYTHKIYNELTPDIFLFPKKLNVAMSPNTPTCLPS